MPEGSELLTYHKRRNINDSLSVVLITRWYFSDANKVLKVENQVCLELLYKSHGVLIT